MQNEQIRNKVFLMALDHLLEAGCLMKLYVEDCDGLGSKYCLKCGSGDFRSQECRDCGELKAV